MAEGLVTDLIKQLASIAAREAEQEIRKDKLQEEAVKLWLEKLKDACYEMDDVVDEWNTAMIKSEIQKHEEENVENALAMMKKVCSFIPSPSCCFRLVDKLVLRHGIAHKIKQVNGKLDEVVRERERYGFELTTRGNAPEVVERPQTTCFVDVSEICGRDKVKDDLVSILLEKGNEEERCPHVISLVGMGGIGKTTLSQLAYNDPKVQAHFDIKMWVCVSDPFDQCRVAKAIIEALKGDHHNITELQSLVTKICELIGGKMFFLVLDDVWTEDPKKWEPFSNAFKKLEGSQSSRILVTTRKIRVAKIMGSTTSTRMINLEVLSEEDCWLVFSKIAFSDKDPEQCEQLENLGRQIAKKCKGLPLAAKTLGSLMRFKISSEQWKNVLDSNLWDLEGVENVIEKDLFASLFLSYYDLPSPLKQCFSYCAVYPKDYVFSSDELVEMWMAQGYIDSKENMEIIAREYLENLAIRSFFQDFENDEDDVQFSTNVAKERTGEEWRKISHIPNIKIGGQYVQRDGQEVKSEGSHHVWDIEFIRSFQDWEMALVDSFMALIYSQVISPGVSDSLCWNPSRRGIFEVRSYYYVLIQPHPEDNFPWKCVWRAKVPPRVAFFTWTAALGKILTTDNLRKRRVIILDWCCMCKSSGESTDHLLLHCSVAWELWSMVCILFGTLWVMPRSVVDLLTCWQGSIGNSEAGKFDGYILRDNEGESDEEEYDEEEFDEEEHAEEEFDKECKAEQNKALDIPCIIKLLDVGRDDVSHAEDEFDKEEDNEKRV
uniref:Reverse transcriptase zinc-binding domain-containing protein n=1 Tax=Fagus sylvatica TaxID=28930 RepID=A0A2N9J9J5_FAGSY